MKVQSSPELSVSTHDSCTGAAYVQPVVPVQDDSSPAVKVHVGAAQASLTRAVYVQAPAPVHVASEPSKTTAGHTAVASLLSHTVSDRQTRSLVAVGAVSSYSCAVHSVHADDTRPRIWLELMYGREHVTVVPASDCVTILSADHASELVSHHRHCTMLPSCSPA